jgi:hypothetical protein
MGQFWGLTNPATVANYPSVAGLPLGNTGQWIVQGVINNMMSITTGTATQIGNNAGGMFQVVIPYASWQVTVTNMFLVNPPIH